VNTGIARNLFWSYKSWYWESGGNGIAISATSVAAAMITLPVLLYVHTFYALVILGTVSTIVLLVGMINFVVVYRYYPILCIQANTQILCTVSWNSVSGTSNLQLVLEYSEYYR
jgi:hypothetical protein